MMETWRIIPGYGNYAVSDCKRVKNLTTGRIIGHPNNSTPGSKDVALIKSDDGQYKMFTKERLYGMCFGYQPPTEQGEMWKESMAPGIMVSNLGRLFSTWEISLMCPQNHQSGYMVVDDHNGKRWKVHRLVADAFIPKEEGRDHVDHINEDKKDNRAVNLRWCTNDENVQFYLANHPRGTSNLSADIAQDHAPTFARTKSDS